MALLVGRHVNRIDKKGRVSVPKPFRAALARSRQDQDADAFNGLYAFPSFKYPALEACEEAFMTRLAQGLEDLDVFSDDQDDLAAVILENARELPMDPEGRIVLTNDLRDYAHIKSDVLFVGRGARMMLWEPKAYDAQRGQAFERAKARGMTLKLPKRPGASAGEGGDE
ncbi:MAG: division/cell wall cluster transcriptional repressor MraZ [Rhodospirillaceae bacterium]